MDSGETRLDGNAAAGELAGMVAAEITGVLAACSSCGAAHAVGAQLAYITPMGVVLRCVGCDNTLITVVRGRGRVWLDVRGVSAFQFADSAATPRP